MKTNYRKVKRYRATHDGDFYYEMKNCTYHRAVRTSGEIRANTCDRVDFYHERIDCRVRARRGDHLLNSWNDFNRSRNYGKSWKDYTRARKQWMTSGVSAEEHEYSRAMNMIMRGLEDAIEYVEQN